MRCSCWGKAALAAAVVALMAPGSYGQIAANGTFDLPSTNVTGNLVSGLGTSAVVLSGGGVQVSFEFRMDGWDVAGGGGVSGYGLTFLSDVVGDPLFPVASSFTGAPNISLAAAGGVVDPALTKIDKLNPENIFPGGGFGIVLFQDVLTGRWGFSNANSSEVTTAGTATLPAYGGEATFDVPVGAKGTYTLSLAPTDPPKFVRANGMTFPPLANPTFSITIQTSRCCHNLGTAGAGCTDNELESECLAAPGGTMCNAATHPGGGACVFGLPGEVCSDPTGGLGDCPSCTSNADCKQFVCSGSAAACSGPSATTCPAGETCVQNTCSLGTCGASFVCSFTNVQAPGECCDPLGGLPNITGVALDANACSQNLCSLDGVQGNAAGLGSPFFPPNSAMTSCDDGRGCTVNDVCDGVTADDATACAGTDINTLMCTTDADCTPGTCDMATGFCTCSENTKLTIEILGKTCSDTGARCQNDVECNPSGIPGGPICNGSQFPIGNCLADSSTVDVAIHMGNSSVGVSTGQFLLTWDTSCLELVPGSVVPCAGSTLDQVISTENPVAGMTPGSLFYAAIASTPGVSTTSPEDLVCMQFTKVPGCGACDICFADLNPKDTLLGSSSGNRVALDRGTDCSKPVKGAGVIDLTVPASVSINTNCNEVFGTTSWNAASATDTCDGALGVNCVADFVPRRFELSQTQAQIDAWIMNGGDIPQGTAFFRCDATNSCGATTGAVWTVDVTAQETIDVTVELEPTVDPGNFTRGIEFEFYSDCAVAPVKICRDITFNTPFDFPGHGRDWFKAPKGNYVCVSAKDPFHTLRSAASIQSINGKCSVVWKGDPVAGGSWLKGGNLDCRKNGFSDANVVNIIDFAAYLSAQVSTTSFVGSTTCADIANRGAGDFNADFNSDGVIDGSDFSSIVDNFLMESKNVCCGAGLAADAGQTTSISVKDLRLQGLGNLAVADLNGDGFVDLTDMEAYLQGATPVRNQVDSVIKSRSIRGR